MVFPKEIDSSIRGRIADMKRAAKAEAYISALSLALTIPDACGLRLYPELKKKSAERYAMWFDEYVARWDYVELPKREKFWAAANGSEPRAAYFTGADCYQLRCVYLHEAANAPHVERGRTPFATIQFRIFKEPDTCDHIGKTTPSTIFASFNESGEFKDVCEEKGEAVYRLDLNIHKFFKSMTKGAERFLEDCPNMNEDETLRNDIFYHPILDFRNME
ncbi:MAG: hypothetical protein HFJ75_00250 [Eggerthellaceae bacterium]|nr:hypothetical protein [Eggerthellaceae bacterium]